jgi:lipase chaperone LimK
MNSPVEQQGTAREQTRDAADKPLLLYEAKDGVAVVTLNHPERRNALSRAMLHSLKRALEQVRALIGDVQASLRAKDQGINDTLENVRIATGNLSDLTESVKQRPWSVLRIKQPKDRKVPK